jgi:hypothetical protein
MLTLRTIRLLPTAPLLDLCALSPAAAIQEPSSPEARRARPVARALEAGRVSEALLEAEAAVELYPADGPLRLRLAQAELCKAMELDITFQDILQEAVFDLALGRSLRNLGCGR